MKKPQRACSLSTAFLLLSLSTANAEIIVEQDETYYNNTHLINSDRIDNFGIFINESGALIDNNATIWQDGDTNTFFINNGNIYNNLSGNIIFFGGSFMNNGSLTNNAQVLFNNDAQFNNNGVINNYSNIEFRNSSTNLNSGTLINDENIILEESTQFINSGSVINRNTFGSRGMFDERDNILINNHLFDNTGVININKIINNGVLTNRKDTNSIFFNNVNIRSGLLTNNNVINSIADGVINLSNNSQLLNTAGAIINIGQRLLSPYDSSGIDLEDSTLINHGTINILSGGILMSSDRNFDLDAAGLHNRENGIINIGSIFEPSTSIIQTSINIENSHVINDGEINNNAGSNFTINNFTRLINNGTFNNNLYSNLRVTGYRYSYDSNITNNNNFYNAGNISLEDENIFINNGMLVNTRSGTIEQNYRFQSDGALINSGSIHNEGVIRINNLTNSGQLNNTERSRLESTHIVNTGDIINSSLISANSIILNAGKLSGTGEIETGHILELDQGLMITENATIAPGNSIGTMSVDGDVFLDGIFELEFGITPDTYQEFDYFDIDGQLVLGPNATLDISLLGDYFGFNNSFDFITADSIEGSFANILGQTFESAGSLYTFDIEVIDGTRQDSIRASIVEVSAVPVPAAVWLFASGFITLMGFQRRKKG